MNEQQLYTDYMIWLLMWISVIYIVCGNCCNFFDGSIFICICPVFPILLLYIKAVNIEMIMGQTDFINTTTIFSEETESGGDIQWKKFSFLQWSYIKFFLLHEQRSVVTCDDWTKNSLVTKEILECSSSHSVMVKAPRVKGSSTLVGQ